jgi:hypothetical protein
MVPIRQRLFPKEIRAVSFAQIWPALLDLPKIWKMFA